MFQVGVVGTVVVVVVEEAVVVVTGTVVVVVTGAVVVGAAVVDVVVEDVVGTVVLVAGLMVVGVVDEVLGSGAAVLTPGAQAEAAISTPRMRPINQRYLCESAFDMLVLAVSIFCGVAGEIPKYGWLSSLIQYISDRD